MHVFLVLQVISRKFGLLGVKPPTRLGSFSEIPSCQLILPNDPHRAGGLTANTPHFMILLTNITKTSSNNCLL